MSKRVQASSKGIEIVYMLLMFLSSLNVCCLETLKKEVVSVVTIPGNLMLEVVRDRSELRRHRDLVYCCCWFVVGFVVGLLLVCCWFCCWFVVGLLLVFSDDIAIEVRKKCIYLYVHIDRQHDNQ